MDMPLNNTQAEVELRIPVSWPLQGHVSLLTLQSPSASVNLDPVLQQLAERCEGQQEEGGLLGLLGEIERAVRSNYK